MDTLFKKNKFTIKGLRMAIVIVVFSLKGNAQIIEDFEQQTPGKQEFISQNQLFYINSELSTFAFDTYEILSCTNCGWNGTAPDSQVISTAQSTERKLEPNFVIGSEETDFKVSSFYLKLLNLSTADPEGPLTIRGEINKQLVFTANMDLASLLNNSTNSTNNGYSFIDLKNVNGEDYSNEVIDALVFSTPWQAAEIVLFLDAFHWEFANTLSTTDLSYTNNNIHIFPNPSSDFLYISNRNKNNTFVIHDSRGKKIQSGIITKDKKIDIRFLETGIYFLNIENQPFQKFVKFN